MILLIIRRSKPKWQLRRERERLIASRQPLRWIIPTPLSDEDLQHLTEQPTHMWVVPDSPTITQIDPKAVRDALGRLHTIPKD